MLLFQDIFTVKYMENHSIDLTLKIQITDVSQKSS